MNLNNALALNAKKTNTVVKTVKTTPDFQLSVEEKSTNITLSDSFMKKADVQNNKLNVYYENADECAYFIFHQGNGVQGESLAIDFFTGRRKSIDNADGTKTLLDEIGTKNPKFKDAKTVSGQTIKELLELQYAALKNELKTSGNFVKHEEEFNIDLKITSVWKLNLINAAGEIPVLKAPVFNEKGIEVSSVIVNSTGQYPPIESRAELIESVFGYEEQLVNNSTESAINNFETVGQYAENQVSLFDENGELNQ